MGRTVKVPKFVMILHVKAAAKNLKNQLPLDKLLDFTLLWSSNSGDVDVSEQFV